MDSRFPLPQVQLFEGRQTFVIEHSRGKKVLHVGCVDSGLTQARLETGELLHARMQQVARELWGVDVDRSGIDLLSQRFDNLFVLDAGALAEDSRLSGQRFDLIVATELLEHLSNPGQFLDGVRELMVPGHTQLLISVPNATRLSLLWTISRGVEFVHPEHVCWYSPYTVSNLLRRHGFHIDETAMYLAGTLPRLGRKTTRATRRSFRQIAERAVGLPKRVATHYACKLLPYFADGVLLLASRPQSSP